MQTHPIVFISYSHKDEVWKDKLLPQLKALEQAGVDMKVWEDRQIDAGSQWYPEIQEAMAGAVVAVLLISADYLASGFCIKEEVPFLLDRQEKDGMLLIPVLVRQCPWKAHRWLAARQMLPRDGKCVAIDFAGDRADAVFSEVAEKVLRHFEKPGPKSGASGALSADERLLDSVVTTLRGGVERTIMMTSESPIDDARSQAWLLAPPADRVDLTRLPETGSALFGRDDELKLLDAAWASGDGTATGQTRVVVFTAHGGVGKSTLVNHWIGGMKRDQFRGATRVFGWSFYSQGVREQSTASADTFIDSALRFFADPDPTAGSPWDKGERLARIAGDERALLVLDGLESVQSGHAFDGGKLRDPALNTLLRGLARHGAGLCLITTREALPDLAGQAGVTYCDLEQISPRAGRALLRIAQLVGTDAELEELAQRFGPHALAVTLLGSYVHEHPNQGIAAAMVLDSLPGEKPLDRVLLGFEQWLGDSPELEILRLLGFFDRPADGGCLRALCASPAIPGVTDRMAGLASAEWDRILARLEKLRLVFVRRSGSRMCFVDAHPSVREYFARQLRKHSDGWREGHRRLYQHLCTTTKEGDQPTLEDLQPLYQAVAHGCQAGLQQDACRKVYYDRILRGRETYGVRMLGAVGSELGAVACFFENLWNRLSPALTEDAQAFLLNEAAQRLRALGRFTEALEPMQLALAKFIRQNDRRNMAATASNLSELELRLGKVVEAGRDAEQSVTFADRSGDAFQRTACRVAHADALHQAGQRTHAEARFREAELIQAENEPHYPLLYSASGFQYCDLLLAKAERESGKVGAEAKAQLLVGACHVVSARAAKALQIVLDASRNPLDIALNRLVLGRAAVFTAVLESNGRLDPATAELAQAVRSFRIAGYQEYLVLGLLSHAWLSSLTGALTGPVSAQSDLDEALEIAERGPMPLFLADIHLYRARLFFHEPKYPWESPQHDLAEARRLIFKHGYLRRKEELEDAESAIPPESTC